MIKIAQHHDVVTLINTFRCEPQNQQHLIDAWIRATEERLGSLPGIISAALHRSKDGNRVLNYAQWKSAEDWENLFRTGSESWFREMAKYAKPDAHLYEVRYLLDKTGQQGK
jgi:heme-degrading monooxygenase HmoA